MAQGISVDIRTGASVVVTIPDPPAPTLDDHKTTKKAAISQSYLDARFAGIVFNGYTLRGDDATVAKMLTAYVRVQKETAALIDWQTESGWIQVGKVPVENACVAMFKHLQDCDTKLKSLYAQIDAAVTVEELNLIAW